MQVCRTECRINITNMITKASVSHNGATLEPNTLVGQCNWQDYHIGTARKMSVDIDATPDLLLLIQQKLRIVKYRYGSLRAISCEQIALLVE